MLTNPQAARENVPPRLIHQEARIHDEMCTHRSLEKQPDVNFKILEGLKMQWRWREHIFLNWQQLDWWVHWVTYIAVIMNESKLLLFELGWGWDSYPLWISVTMRGYLPAIFRGWPMTGRKTIPVQWRHTRAHPLRWSTMSKDYGLETVYQSLLQYITLVHPAISMSELSELTW